jgi:hypothetical protein
MKLVHERCRQAGSLSYGMKRVADRLEACPIGMKRVADRLEACPIGMKRDADRLEACPTV